MPGMKKSLALVCALFVVPVVAAPRSVPLSPSDSASLAAPLPLNGATVTTYFSPRGGAAHAAGALIDGAQGRVLLAGYGFTNKTIAAALKRAQARGVPVQVVLDRSNQTARYSGATYLQNAGVDVRIDSRYPIMHHKFIVVDHDVAFGSMNFTAAGDEKNAENFNVFRGTPMLAEKYASEFRRLYDESTPYQRR